MGGYGSGRRDHKKQTVESCRVLDTAVLHRLGILQRDASHAGVLTWTNSGGEARGSVGYELQTEADMPGQSARENGKKGGRPKGSYGPARLDKIAAREHVRKRVTERLDALLDAQIDNALGISYMVTRDRNTGKFIRVGPAMASRADEETIQVWQKDPNVHACIDLLNRAMDKPAEQSQQLEHTGKDMRPVRNHRPEAVG